MIDNGGDAMRAYDTRERKSEMTANRFITCDEEKRDPRRDEEEKSAREKEEEE